MLSIRYLNIYIFFNAYIYILNSESKEYFHENTFDMEMYFIIV